MLHRLSPLILGAALAAGLAGPASAWCIDGLGCSNRDRFTRAELMPIACGSLWEMRNRIFYENGYCFHTARGQRVFDNTGCTYTNSGDVPMNRVERANVETILSVERAKGCR